MLKSGVYSSFDPRSLGTCSLWLDSADSNSLTLSGTNVTRWSDKSGNAYHADASQNAFATWSNTSNGVSFSNSLYTTTYSASLSNETIFVVFSTPTLCNVSNTLVGSQSGGRQVLIGANVASNFGLGNAGTALYASVGGLANGVRYIGVAQLSNNATSVGINGSPTLTSGSTASYTAGKTTLLGREDATSFGYVGSVQELIFFSNALTSTQRQQVEGYLASKWGLGRGGSPTLTLSAAGPTSLFSPTAWFDATDATTIDLSGTSVTAWRDKSGNSNHTTSVTGTVTYSLNAVNGLPGLYLSSSYLRGAISITTSNVQAFAVATLESNASNFGYLLAMSSNTGAASWNNGASVSPFGRNGTTATLRTIRNSTSAIDPNTVSYGVPFLVGSCNVAGTGSIGTNARALGSAGNGATGAFGITNYALGSETNTGANQFWRGYVSEVLIYNKTLTTDQRLFVENYLMQKWNVTSLLPQTHPYRFAPPALRPFVPLDLSGLVVWLDAADESQITYSTAPTVTQLRDKGALLSNSNAYSCTATRVSQGTIGRSLPTLSNAGGATTQVHGITGNSPMTYALVGKVNSTSNQIFIRGNTTSGGGDGFSGSLHIGIQSNKTTPFLGITGIAGLVTGTATTSNAHILLGSWDGSVGRIHDNGTLTGTSSTTTLNQTSATTSLDFGNNELGEFMIFNRTLSESERQLLESYFAQKWGLVGLTPSNHPARLAPALAPQFNLLNLGNCSFWLDAADLGTLTLSGSNVAQWNDKSGNGYNATQTTGGSQPSLIGNQIAFSDNRFLNFPQAAINNTTQYSLFLLFSPIASLNWIMAKQFNGVGSYNMLSMSIYWIDSVGTSNVMYWGPFANSGVVDTGTELTLSTLQLIEITFDGTTCSFFRNGTLLNTATSGPTLTISNVTNATNCTLGVWDAGGFQSSGVTNFRLGEFAFYNSFLSTSRRQQVEGYLARKWGLLTSLPSNHPYRVTPLF